MTVSLHSAAATHADHRQWKNDLETWENDIANWRREHEDALAALEQVADCIRLHNESLDDHEQALQKTAFGLTAHEKKLADLLQSSGPLDLDDDLQQQHQQEAAQHQLNKAAHERIKRHHHRAMAQVAILKASVEAAL
ncbi:hypothetical protein K227x_04620 [Rubripirellula lacrimiformis]|uniref:Uncharacterized protein n=1 Tax=Rubripirellula lacrimiformis TaxID=1930273 RepID=A0A517N4M8_9BACT|nr:hypothetical protein K227x_04620 [Rubripirellula lacrimiformis]